MFPFLTYERLESSYLYKDKKLKVCNMESI